MVSYLDCPQKCITGITATRLDLFIIADTAPCVYKGAINIDCTTSECWSSKQGLYYYCVSLDAVDIMKLCVCVAVGKPILIAQPVSVGPANED